MRYTGGGRSIHLRVGRPCPAIVGIVLGVMMTLLSPDVAVSQTLNTGSGSLAYPVNQSKERGLHYGTPAYLQYQHQDQRVDQEQQVEQDAMPRYYHKRRQALEQQIHRRIYRASEEDRYSFGLVFHNCAGVDEGAFAADVAMQLERLNGDFNQVPVLASDHPYRDIVEAPGFAFGLASRPIITHKAHAWRDWNGVKLLLTEERDLATPPSIHIWVVDVPDSIGSYAQYPEGPPHTDGIVVDVDYFGKGVHEGYDQGKTLTSLMAQFFGIRSLYTYSDCVDDLVADTPRHHMALRMTLPPEASSPCDHQPLMSDNYMSHAPDGERLYFTRGQVSRMKLILQYADSRSSLLHTPKKHP